jgi:hypothetical protein
MGTTSRRRSHSVRSHSASAFRIREIACWILLSDASPRHPAFARSSGLMIPAAFWALRRTETAPLHAKRRDADRMKCASLGRPKTIGPGRILIEGEMAPDNNVKLSDDVLQLLKQRAEADGLSLDEAASQAVRIGLEEARWRSLLTTGRRYGQQSGYSEDVVVALVERFRKENRGR